MTARNRGVRRQPRQVPSEPAAGQISGIHRNARSGRGKPLRPDLGHRPTRERPACYRAACMAWTGSARVRPHARSHPPFVVARSGARGERRTPGLARGFACSYGIPFVIYAALPSGHQHQRFLTSSRSCRHALTTSAALHSKAVVWLSARLAAPNTAITDIVTAPQFMLLPASPWTFHPLPLGLRPAAAPGPTTPAQP